MSSDTDTTVIADIDAEQAVLGLAMASPAQLAAARAHLNGGAEFSRPAHEVLWRLLCDEADAGRPTEPVALIHAVRGDKDALRTLGGPSAAPQYVHTLYAGAPLAGSGGYYAQTVAALHTRRQLINQAETTARLARDLTIPLEQLQLDHLDRVDRVVREMEQPERDKHDTARLVTGGTFILDVADRPDAVWGEGSDVLWARSESLLIAGPSGVGKSTLGQNLVFAGIGLADPHVLGYPVEDLGRVLYLASDRPNQIARSMRRLVTEENRAELDDRLVVWKGPPPKLVISDPLVYVDMARKSGADTVVIDSIKDQAVGISKDDVGAALNIAFQELLARDHDLLAFHHTRKGEPGKSTEPVSLDELLGSSQIPNGAGSVLSVYGAPSDPIVSFRPLKMAAGEISPFRLRIEFTNGHISIWHKTDVMAVLLHGGKYGTTAQDLAAALFPNAKEKNTDSEVEKARRRLEVLLERGLATRVEPAAGQATRYYAAFDEAGIPDGGTQ